MKKIVTNISKDIILKTSDIKLKKVKDYIENNVIRIYKDEEVCDFLGFGGAITESSAYNYSLLNDDLKKDLIDAYYSDLGLNYDLGRISLGSCDFSLKSYDNASKKDLSDFNLDNDYKYIIPMLKDIYNKKIIDLLASPWTPPRFMKNNKSLIFGGKLKTKYYELYSTYLSKYVNAYKDLGFNVLYLSMQNEPYATQKWESCTFSLEEQKKFIYEHLNNKLDGVNILLHDHNKEDLYNVYKNLYIKDNNVKGICFHWYSGTHYNNLKLIRKYDKDILLINSEMCCGFSPYSSKWMSDATLYTKDIINSLNSGVNAYLDWNILLDFNGGPNHKNNYCKSPIILNENKDNFIKTPIYYYLYHLTRISENYKIIYNDTYDNDLYILSAKKDNKIIITIYNDSNDNKDYNLIIDNNYLKDSIESKSIITYEI